MSRWFRFYDDAVNDPKVLKMPEALRWRWVALLCMASKNDGLIPTTGDVAIVLRITGAQADKLVADLVERGLLDVSGNGWTPHNWNGRQFKNDVSTERVKRFRERSKKQDETVSETPPETEQKQRQSRAEQKQPDAAPDWTAVAEQACQAAGMNPGRAVNEIPTSIAWAKAGYDPAVILKAIRQVAAKPGYRPPGSLAYFRQPIADAHAVKALPAPKVADEWGPALKAWRTDQTWLSSWGPRPGEPGCRVPSHLLNEARAA